MPLSCFTKDIKKDITLGKYICMSNKLLNPVFMILKNDTQTNHKHTLFFLL